MAIKDKLSAINQMGGKNFDQVNALNELNMRTWEKLASRQLDVMNLFMEQGLRRMKLASESGDYADFLKGEMELAKEMGTRLMEETKANMELASQLRDEYRDWFQSGLAEISPSAKKAAPKKG